MKFSIHKAGIVTVTGIVTALSVSLIAQAGWNVPGTDYCVGFGCEEDYIIPPPNIPGSEPEVLSQRRAGSKTLVASSGLCLDAAGETWTLNGGKIQVYECNGSPNQQWIGDNGRLVIRTTNGLKCLDAAGETWTLNGGKVQVYECNDSPNQQWIGDNGRLVIRTTNGLKCLDAAGETWTLNGGKIQVYECNGSPNQQWRFR